MPTEKAAHDVYEKDGLLFTHIPYSEFRIHLIPPAVVIAPAQPAGRLIGRTNVKPATKLAISRMRVVAVANLIDHKGSNLFVGTSTGTLNALYFFNTTR
jgi:hypothetical protein